MYIMKPLNYSVWGLNFFISMKDKKELGNKSGKGNDETWASSPPFA